MIQKTYRAPLQRLARHALLVAPIIVGSSAALAGFSESSPDNAPMSPDALASMPLETLMQVSLVSTALLFKQPVTDAPAAAVMRTAEDIRNFGWRTLADALASLPGVYTSYDRTHAYLGARGFGRPGDYNSRFLLLLDGMRINDPVYDQAAIGTDFPVDMDHVERIEYLPDPGSAEMVSAGGLYQFRNVDHADAKGIALAYEQRIAGGTTIRASYSWQRARNSDTSANLQDSPHHLAKLNVSMPLFYHAACLGTELRCVSSRLAQAGSAGGYCLGGCAAEQLHINFRHFQGCLPPSLHRGNRLWRVLRGRKIVWRFSFLLPRRRLANATVGTSRLIAQGDLSFSVYNVTDKRYADPAGPEFAQDVIAQQSRTLLLKFVYGF